MRLATSMITGEKHPTFVDYFCHDLFLDSNFLFVYAGFVNQNFLMLKPNEIEHIGKVIKNATNESTRIIFDCLGEGIAEPMLRVLHKIIDGKVNPKNVYYLTASQNIHSIYRRMRERDGIAEPINVRVVSTWESIVAKDKPYKYPYEIREKEKIFLCFNRVARVHRFALFGLMATAGLVEKGYYSYLHTTHGAKTDIGTYFNNALHTYSPDLYSKIEAGVRQYADRIPLKLNIEPDENATYLKDTDYDMFKNSYFSLVTETLFNESDGTIFFSEKIFKPIAMKHPFILVNAPGSLARLRELGYRTFETIIDESYDTINNHEERLKAIVNEVDRLSKLTPEEWIKWQEVAKEIVDHNYLVLKSKKLEDFDHGTET